MQRFSKNKSLQWSIDKNQFWDCITEPSLIEAIVFKSLSLPVFVEYVTQNLDTLEIKYLDRLLNMTDPLSPYIRTVARANKNPNDSSGETVIIFFFKSLFEIKLKFDNNFLIFFCRKNLILISPLPD